MLEQNISEMKNPGGVILGTKDIGDRKSTRLNSSHVRISYAVFCLKKKIVTVSAMSQLFSRMNALRAQSSSSVPDLACCHRPHLRINSKTVVEYSLKLQLVVNPPQL